MHLENFRVGKVSVFALLWILTVVVFADYKLIIIFNITYQRVNLVHWVTINKSQVFADIHVIDQRDFMQQRVQTDDEIHQKVKVKTVIQD